MSYIITDFQEIENLDYKNSTEINEKLSTNSELFIDKIAKKLNDSSDIQFKVFLREEVNTLFYTWKKLKESKDIENVDVKDLYVNSYWHTYKSLEIKYKDFTNGIFKDLFDTFSDNEKYNREIVWNRFSNFNQKASSNRNLNKKLKKLKFEKYFNDELAINFFIVISEKLFERNTDLHTEFSFLYRKMLEEKLIYNTVSEYDFRKLLEEEFEDKVKEISSKLKTTNNIGKLVNKEQFYELVKQNCSQ